MMIGATPLVLLGGGKGVKSNGRLECENSKVKRVHKAKSKSGKAKEIK